MAAELLRLALPIVIVQVGLMAMGVVDSIMVGRISAAALAGVALGNVYFYACAVFGMGTLLALDPIVAQAVGARDEAAVTRALQRGLILSAVLTVPISLLLLTVRPALVLLGQPADVVPIASGYVWREIPGVLPFLAFTVLRQTLQALGRMRAIVIAIVLANLLNVALNWALIYGHWGAPALGALGSAWSTTISRFGMTAGLGVLAWRGLRPHLAPLHPETLATAPLGRMLALGAPIGAQMQLEFGVFGAIGLLMGRLGTVPVAAHQIALNLASLTFMVPLGVSAAGAVLVGRAVGRGDAAEAGRATRAALAFGVGFMGLTALLFLIVPAPLARVYSADGAVIALAAALLPIAGVFQMFDGIQVVSIGALRGLGDTRTPFGMNLVGFWLIGLPVSLLLGFRTPLGPRGLWWGLVVGLVAVAIGLLVRLRARLRQAVARVRIDDSEAALTIDTLRGRA
jgi:multidrug resistance protein, MATE family